MKKKGIKNVLESTNANLLGMILPGLIVIGTPFLLGSLFVPIACCGYLAGVIASSVQLAISASNTEGSWDNAKNTFKLEN